MLAICERISIEIALENGSKFSAYAAVRLFSNTRYSPRTRAEDPIGFIILMSTETPYRLSRQDINNFFVVK